MTFIGRGKTKQLGRRIADLMAKYDLTEDQIETAIVQYAWRRNKQVEQQNKSLSRASNDDYANFANKIANAVIERFRPLLESREEIAYLIGFISGVVTRDEDKIPRETVNEAGIALGNELNRADWLDSQFSSLFNDLDQYFDYSGFHDFRTAAKEFVTGKDPKGQQLREMVKRHPGAAKHVQVAHRLKMRRNRGRRDPTTIEDYDAVAAKLKAKPQLSIEKAASEVAEELGRKNETTVKQHYDRINGDRTKGIQPLLP